MAVVSIQYNEGGDRNLDYKSVKITYHNGKDKKKFSTGDFVKDWFDCLKFIIMEMGDKEYIMHSSSVNHFIMDGAPFDSAYLILENNEPILKYLNDSSEDDKIVDEGIELFVPRGTKPSWQELKLNCL